jgi:hypothetical protein
MQFVHKYRIQALICALAVLLCDLISRPFVSMGLNDDAPYIVMAHTLASTGHIVYNGWATAMLGWQLYVGAAFIKLFGFSYTTLRMSTLLVAMAIAFLFQRILVRSGITERNATIGTLTLVLSPLYLMHSVTFMSDIWGFFAIVICLYSCIRALQSHTARPTIAWICFAILTNALFGTSRQIAWLGILVMVPSTLWLLRSRRRVLFAGATANLAGAFFILGCMQWLKRQPYTVPEHLLPKTFSISFLFWQFLHLFLYFPFWLLPIAALFLPQIRKCRPRVIAIVSIMILGYLFIAIHPSHLRGNFLMEPTVADWFGANGTYQYLSMEGTTPAFLPISVQALLTAASFGALFGLIASLLGGPLLGSPLFGGPSPDSRPTPPAVGFATALSWKQVGALLGPFTVAYALLLVPRGASPDEGIRDRYALGLVVGILLCIIRYYQERIRPRLPAASIVLVAIVAVYSITVMSHTFSLYRARVALAAELRAAGIPDTSVDNGWEYNLAVELQHAGYINWPTIAVPANAYVPPLPLPAGRCSMFIDFVTPHIRPLYSVSFSPDACYGPAPFAPVHYSRWPYRTPGTLYVIHYLPPAKS